MYMKYKNEALSSNATVCPFCNSPDLKIFDREIEEADLAKGFKPDTTRRGRTKAFCENCETYYFIKFLNIGFIQNDYIYDFETC